MLSRLQEESARKSAKMEGRVVQDLEQPLYVFAKMEKLDRIAGTMACIYVVDQVVACLRVLNFSGQKWFTITLCVRLA